MKITARQGRAIKFECNDGAVLQRVENALGIDDMAKVIGEFAFGLNRKARVSANFVEAEKLGDAVHFAFGHNTDMPGGMNTSATHMDFLVSKPTVEATRNNGEKFIAMKNGQIL